MISMKTFALLSALPRVIARNPLEETCIGSNNEPLCLINYSLPIRCGKSEPESECATRWCDAIRSEVGSEEAEIISCGAGGAGRKLSSNFARSAKPARRLQTNQKLASNDLQITFSVRGWAQDIETKVASKMENVRDVANARWDYNDDDEDDAYTRAEDAFMPITTCDQGFCTNHKRSFKHNQGAASCAGRVSSKDTVTATSDLAAGATAITVASGKGGNFAKGEFIEVAQNDGTASVYKITGISGDDLTVTANQWKTVSSDATVPKAVKHLGNYPTLTLDQDFAGTDNASKLATTKEYFVAGDQVQIGEEILTLGAWNGSSEYAIASRGNESTTAFKHLAGAMVKKVGACRDVCCAEVTCTSSMCEASDKYVAHGSNTKCAYFDCAKSLFKNDVACCKVGQATCSSGFRLFDDSGIGADELFKLDEAAARKQCPEGKHVAFDFCAGAACTASAGDPDELACCVKFNGTGSEFEKSTEVSVKSVFSTGAQCDALTFANFFLPISNAIAASLGVPASDVVLTGMPKCPGAARRLEGKAETAVFRVKGEPRLGEKGKWEAKAEAVFESFAKRLEGNSV